MNGRCLISLLFVSFIFTPFVCLLYPYPYPYYGTDDKPKIEPESLSPVVIAVWDTGVDVTLFNDRLFINKKEIPGNNRDDDKNGFVDDIHGIAYNLDNEPIKSLLGELGDNPKDILEYKKYIKGFSDYNAAINSPQVMELQKKMSSIPKKDLSTFKRGLVRYISYLHGTYMSGIAVDGNPAARVLVVRFSEDVEGIEIPTVEKAKKAARVEVEIIDYFKKNNVKVVNISWFRNLAGVEALLGKHDKDKPWEERKRLARQIFAVGANSLKKAMADAPGILFVVVSGFFKENVIPPAFELPNILRVGAVGKTGEARMFTGFRHVDIYAVGEEVAGVLPGGDKIRLTGRSMAAPVVTNLAARLLAVDPELSVGELKKIILNGADIKTFSNGKTGKILNPRKSLHMIKKIELFAQ
jgi:subtilisin family serine protease